MGPFPGSGPVLADIPERLTIQEQKEEINAQEEKAKEPERSEAETEAAVTSLLPYADGVYTGSAQGYGGSDQGTGNDEGRTHDRHSDPGSFWRDGIFL